MDYKFESIPVKAETKPLNEAGRECLDKMFGNPCTDMYKFEFLSPVECKEKGVVWEVKSYKKKDNITEDQRIRKQRPEYTYDNDEIKMVNLEEIDLCEGFAIDIKETMDKAIIDEIKRWNKDIKDENKN